MNITAKAIRRMAEMGLTTLQIAELAELFAKPERRPVPVTVCSAPYQPRYDFIGPKVARLPEREWLPLWGRIMRRDGEICAYCKQTTGPWCIDHVTPLSRGGSNAPYNLVVACIPCNSSKSDRLLHEWQGRYV